MSYNLAVLFCAALNCFSAIFSPSTLAAQPNVLVIAIDDLNDWIGCLAGHPQVQTPHIDALAARGVLFTNAHVQATFCGPSRISLLSGRYPRTTGCYGFERYSQLASLRNHPPFPLHFRQHGYQTLGGGKIFHHGTGDGWVAEAWQTIFHAGSNPRPPGKIHWEKPVWDWGPWPQHDSQMGDYELAQAAADALHQPYEKPFFITVGFRRPHVPLHVPPKWFAAYPEETVILPTVSADDLADLPHPEFALETYFAPRHAEVVDKDLWRSLVQAYLASIAFVDHCVGEVLRGLDAGPNRNQTIVILLSDHGFHLGEKQHWAKRTLWEETTRIPLIIAGPDVESNRRTDAAVGLIDIYPTLCDLTGVPMPAGLEGRSLKPLLKDPTETWDRPAFTTFQPGDLAVRTRNWRYIVYPDGSEELYDHQNDPNEWSNLANDPAFAAIKQELAASAATRR
ncbi:sulfatase [Planctomycetaceae bacterium SH139]